MSDPKLSDLLAVAIDAARTAGQTTLKYFGNQIEVIIKADGSPVTRADIESEAILRREIAKHFPHHAVLGEESGETAGSSGHIRWIIDPLDGTKSFIRGVPMYGVLVGVEIDGQPRAGAVYLPATDEMIAGAIGLGCTHNDKSCRVSDVNRFEDATITTTNAARCASRWDGFIPLAKRAHLLAGWGDAYGHVMIATGRADIMLDPRASAWDLAALVPILTEAGGKLTDWTGRETINGGDGVATNGHLHPAIITALADARPDGKHIR
jgi:histidinol phosphatase-like enzyme (inositol monophosphatase family)